MGTRPTATISDVITLNSEFKHVVFQRLPNNRILLRKTHTLPKLDYHLGNVIYKLQLRVYSYLVLTYLYSKTSGLDYIRSGPPFRTLATVSS